MHKTDSISVIQRNGAIKTELMIKSAMPVSMILYCTRIIKKSSLVKGLKKINYLDLQDSNLIKYIMIRCNI
jgi:hypothetical protein